MEEFIMSIIEMFEDDQFIYQITICHLIAFYCFIKSIRTKNFSQVDRLWPILPAVYSWSYILFEFLLRDGLDNMDTFFRMLIVTILITSWSIRLTFNTWRRGYYRNNTEDYRWEHVKKFFKFPKRKIPFQIFNFLFIAIFQNLLLYLITLPLWYIQKYNRNDPFNHLDLLLTILFVIALAIETIADEQQWNYQYEKKQWLLTSKVTKGCMFTQHDFKRGFVAHGLWKYSRHPNFFAEMSIWWIVYGFSISSQSRSFDIGEYPRLFNTSIIGTVMLTLLFQASTFFTETISSSKYEYYIDYRKSVSRFVPSIFSSFKSHKNE